MKQKKYCQKVLNYDGVNLLHITLFFTKKKNGKNFKNVQGIGLDFCKLCAHAKFINFDLSSNS